MSTIAVIGSTQVDLGDTSQSPEQIRQSLQMTHPEIKRSDISVKESNGTRYVQFKPKAGRKG